MHTISGKYSAINKSISNTITSRVAVRKGKSKGFTVLALLADTIIYLYHGV